MSYARNLEGLLNMLQMGYEKGAITEDLLRKAKEAANIVTKPKELTIDEEMERAISLLNAIGTKIAKVTGSIEESLIINRTEVISHQQEIVNRLMSQFFEEE